MYEYLTSYQSYFENNSTDCPVLNYDLVLDEAGSTLLSHVGIGEDLSEGFTIDEENFRIVIDTDLDYEALVEEVDVLL